MIDLDEMENALQAYRNLDEVMRKGTILAMIAELREARADEGGVADDYQDLARAWNEERTKVDEALGLSAPFSLDKTMAAIERMKTELRAARDVVEITRSHLESGCIEQSDDLPVSMAIEAYDAAIGGEGER